MPKGHSSRIELGRSKSDIYRVCMTLGCAAANRESTLGLDFECSSEGRSEYAAPEQANQCAQHPKLIARGRIKHPTLVVAYCTGAERKPI